MRRLALMILPSACIALFAAFVQVPYTECVATRISGLIGYSCAGTNGYVVTSSIAGTTISGGSQCLVAGTITVTVTGTVGFSNSWYGIPIGPVAGAGTYRPTAAIGCVPSPTNVTHWVCLRTSGAPCSDPACDLATQAQRQEKWSCDTL